MQSLWCKENIEGTDDLETIINNHVKLDDSKRCEVNKENNVNYQNYYSEYVKYVKTLTPIFS